MAYTTPKAPRPASKDVTPPAKPVATFRYGNVSAAIFANHATTQDGRTFDVLNVSLRRSFKRADGTWGHVETLRQDDLLPASHALVQCYEYLSAADKALEGQQD
jgi:hypothetical protein